MPCRLENAFAQRKNRQVVITWVNYLLKSEPHRGLDLAGSLILYRFYAGFRVSLLEEFFGHDFKKVKKRVSNRKMYGIRTPQFRIISLSFWLVYCNNQPPSGQASCIGSFLQESS